MKKLTRRLTCLFFIICFAFIAHVCIIPLSKGFYPFRLEYYHRNPDFKLDWGYVTPANIAAKKIIPIPFELQYGRQ